MAKSVGTKKKPTEPASGGLSLRDLGVTDGVGRADLPRLEPRPAALLMVHPERWCVMKGEIIPLVGRLPIEGGVGNVRVVDPKTGALSISTAVSIKQKRGWQVLLPDVAGPGTSYLYEAAPGVYLTQWETAHAGSSRVSTDAAGYVQWMRSLIDSGTIQPPQPYVLEGMRQRVQTEVRELQDRVRTVPSAQVDLDAKLAELAVIDRAMKASTPRPVKKAPVTLDQVVADPGVDQE